MVAQEEDLEVEVVKETEIEIGKEGGDLVPEIEKGVVVLGIEAGKGDIVPGVDLLERGGEIDRGLGTERKIVTIGNIDRGTSQENAIVTTRDHLEIVIVTEKTEIGKGGKIKKNRRLDR